MTKRFDRADADSRGLAACFRELADRLAEEGGSLRSFLHDKHYPEFGLIGGMKRRTLIRRFREWDDIFRDYAERLFRLCYEIEEKLVYSIAIDGRAEHKETFSALRARRVTTDKLLRALHARIKYFKQADQIDSEKLYEFCTPVERTALFCRFVALTLFLPTGRDTPIRDPQFIDIDWGEIERYAERYPEEVEAEIVTSADEPIRPDFRSTAYRARSEDVSDQDMADLEEMRRRPPRGDRATLLRRLK
jgi:hypothetical protein